MMTARTTSRHALAAAIVCLIAGPSAAAPPRQSIEEFVALKSRWANFAALSLPLKVEGRLASISYSRGYLRFDGCELPFQTEGATKLSRLPPDCTTVEVTGRLASREGKLWFVLESLRHLPGDLQRFRSQEARIDRAKPDGWYELAGWALGRSRFYKDAELEAEARAAYRTGLFAERAALAPGDWQGVLSLARKADGFGLPETLEQELVHEAYRIRWDAVQKEQRPDLKSLLEALARDLPGCRAPLASPLAEPAAKYRRQPLAVYGDADAGERKTLHRVLYADVALQEIERRASPDGGNGFEIAAEIEKQLPERRDLAESYRRRELSLKLSRVGSAGREAMLALAEHFRTRCEPEKARETIEKWLEARGKELRRDGPAGLLRLAEEHVRLLEDTKTAVELLKEAHKLSPGTPEIVKRLNQLGYFHHEGRWLTRAELEQLPEDPTEAAIRRGEVQRGMTPGQVRRALAGSPTSVARVASSININEVWVYAEPDGTRLAIHFLRRKSQPRAESKVLSISEIVPR